MYSVRSITAWQAQPPVRLSFCWLVIVAAQVSQQIGEIHVLDLDSHIWNIHTLPYDGVGIRTDLADSVELQQTGSRVYDDDTYALTGPNKPFFFQGNKSV
jgi:hypothetical protein